MNVTETAEGRSYLLTSVGTDEHFVRRASSMGLVPGTNLRVIRNQKKMPLLLFARDTLIGLNRKDAEGMEVEPHA